LTGSDGNAILLYPTVVILAVPIIFTVGIKMLSVSSRFSQGWRWMGSNIKFSMFKNGQLYGVFIDHEYKRAIKNLNMLR